jgi:hypothetical protein
MTVCHCIVLTLRRTEFPENRLWYYAEASPSCAMCADPLWVLRAARSLLAVGPGYFDTDPHLLPSAPLLTYPAVCREIAHDRAARKLEEVPIG